MSRFLLLLVAAVHLAVALPGIARRGVIAEEIQPYLTQYPKLLEAERNRVVFLPPNDDSARRPRWVGTKQWPELAYQGRERVWPIFVRGHQTALGTYFGIALAPLLGGGVGGVRRSSVLLELGLLCLVWGLARRLGFSRGWATVAALGCALSPGLWFFARSGYGFELASRVAMMATLFAAAPKLPLTYRRAAAVGALFALAVLCRIPIAATLAPVTLAMLVDRQRYAGAPFGGALAVGIGAPVMLLGAAVLTLPFAAGGTPGANLPIAALGSRTLTAPAVGWMQLAWVVDPRVILGPLVHGDLAAPAGWIRPLLGAAVPGIALWRWWRGRAGEAERLFLWGLLGNALAGAWLYGDPRQFQLGLALEPLFVLAVVQQLSELRAGAAVALALGGARVATLVSLMVAEGHTDNPMLSGRAQRTLVLALPNEDLITTSYDHVGVLESLTADRVRPIHAWRLLRRAPPESLVEQWKRLLDAHPARYVLLTRAANLEAGPFSDDHAVASALESAAHVVSRRVIEGDGGGPVFELVTIAR